MKLVATLGLTLLGAAPAPCPTPSEPTGPAAELSAIEPRRVAALAGAEPPCVAGAALALGELRLALGRPRAALAPLARAVVAGDGDAGRAWLALARAQAGSDQPYEAMRSLAVAQRSFGTDNPRGQAARDDATLLARFHLRRGGSVWGAWRFDPGFAIPLKALRLSPTAIAASGTALWAGGKRGAAALTPGTASPSLPAGARVTALAANARGAVAFLLETGEVVHGSGRTFPLLVAGERRPLRARSLALGMDDSVAVVADGKVHLFDAEGRPEAAFAVGGDALAVAADGRGQWHVLLGGDGGIARIDRTGEAPGSAEGRGEGWSLAGADAIAADRFGASYVLHRVNATVLLFDSEGQFAGHLEAPADQRALLRSARSIAVDGSGRIYLLDGERVVRYR